jgi:hypothetical protein
MRPSIDLDHLDMYTRTPKDQIDVIKMMACADGTTMHQHNRDVRSSKDTWVFDLKTWD